MKKLLLGIMFTPLLCSAESYEFQRHHKLDGTSVKSNAVLHVDITQNGRELTLGGTSNPESMSASCNVEGFTNVTNKISKIDYFLKTVEPTSSNSDSCGVLVDVWRDSESNKTMATVRISDGYGCNTFCGIQGTMQDLEGVYY